LALLTGDRIGFFDAFKVYSLWYILGFFNLALGFGDIASVVHDREEPGR
jgi:hypothetical protein